MDPPAVSGLVREVALSRLRTTGFAMATLGDIARAAELDEADLRRIYGDAEGLIKELVSPLSSRLEEITAVAATSDLRRVEELRPVIERYLDALTAHRALVGAVLRDPAAASSESIGGVRDAMHALRDELARQTGPSLESRIRAASALGAVEDAVLEPTEFDPTLVRDVLTDAAVAILLS